MWRWSVGEVCGDIQEDVGRSAYWGIGEGDVEGTKELKAEN